MKNYKYLLLFFLLIFQKNVSQNFVSTSPENKKALVEKFTGINCNYCPCGDVVIYGAVDSNPENIIVVKIHEGSYAVPGSGQPDFRTNYGDALSSQSFNTGNPQVSINRHFFPDYTSGGGTAISACYSNASGIAMQSPPTYAIDEILAEPAYLNVAAEAEINYSTNTLTVNSEVYYTGISPTPLNYLNIAIVQDNTIGFQAGSSLAAGGANFVHNDRLVDFITGQWGEEITTAEGSLIQTTHSYNIPENYNGIPVVLDDLKVIVFVSESTQEVINVTRAEMEYNTLTYDLSVDSIDSPVIAGNLSENESVTVTISNNGDNDISNFEMSYDVDGINISTENYTETISSGLTTQFTFEVTYDFSEVGDYSLVVFASFNEDENQNNNSISEIITNVGGGDCPDEYGPPIIWRENFECYEPFISENIGDWIIYDIDGLATYSSAAMDFPSETYSGAGFIYNQALATATNDPNTNPQEPSWWETYEGNQGLYFISCVPSGSVTQNNDWMISPEISLVNIESPTLRFMAKTLKDDWGLERFRVAIGNSTNYNEFTVISEGAYLEAPTDWTLYEFDLSTYEGQNIRVGINYVSDDNFVLQMDEFVVEGTLGLNDNEISDFEYYFDRFNNLLSISSGEILRNIEIFNMLGQKVVDEKINNYNHQLSLSNPSTSIYFVKVESDNGINTFKISVR